MSANRILHANLASCSDVSWNRLQTNVFVSKLFVMITRYHKHNFHELKNLRIVLKLVKCQKVVLNAEFTLHYHRRFYMYFDNIVIFKREIILSYLVVERTALLSNNEHNIQILFVGVVRVIFLEDGLLITVHIVNRLWCPMCCAL